MAAMHLEQAGKWLGGDYDYYESPPRARYYLPIAERIVSRCVAAPGRSRRSAGPSTSSARRRGSLVPFYKRYFLGGATNLRGWGRFDVAPLSGSGLPIGGHTFANFSTELRVPIWGKLGGVLFLDGGNVWTNPWDFNLNDLRYDVGPGLRYNTPIGPFRVDLGYPAESDSAACW